MPGFDETYPHITRWAKDRGWIEIGYDDYSRSFARVLDIGGMIWEGNEDYDSLDEAMQALDKEIADWLKDNRR